MIKRTIYIGNPAYLSLSSRQMIIRRLSTDVTGEDIAGSEEEGAASLHMRCKLPERLPVSLSRIALCPCPGMEGEHRCAGFIYRIGECDVVDG